MTGQTVQSTLLQLRDGAWDYDYFAVMRRLDAVSYPQPKWGLAPLPSAESIRVGQEPSLAFAPAALSRWEDATSYSPARLRQHFIRYIGPNGPLPVHLSDFIQDRARNYNDRTWLAFLDVFTHRFALHFYRAWAQARPAVSLDRPEQDSFRRYSGALIGIGGAQRQNRDPINDDARLHFSGWLTRQVRSRDSVDAVISAYFGVPAKLEQWVGHWLELGSSEISRIGLTGVHQRLGHGMTVGRKVWDRQHRVRLHLGPLNAEQHSMFLPNGSARKVLQRWMQQLLGDEYEWDAVLILRDKSVMATRLGMQSRLGWTSWIGCQPRTSHAADVRIAG